MGNKETREYKSNTFSLLMRTKKYSLEIYNALNNTGYEDPELIDVLSLDGGFSLSVRNDAAFIVDSVVSLFEHQSTRNPNMPLRCLLYIANLYRYLVRNKDIFGQNLLKLPEPRFIVFYNGTEPYPEEQELKLSNAYKGAVSNPVLELKCKVFNVNPGFSEKLKQSCEGIRGYCIYVEKAREYIKTMEIHLAIGKAIDECIEEGVLPEFFEENRDMIISADAIDGTIERREEFAEARGAKKERRRVIENVLRKGSTPESVAELVGIPIEEVLSVKHDMLEEV